MDEGTFIEKQDLRVLEQGASDRDALLLASAERDAAFADHRLVLLRQSGSQI
jgi:hypothetical protein